MSKKLDINDVKREFVNRGYIPLFDKYNNCGEKLLAETQEGYKVFISIEKLKIGRNPQIFYINNPYTIQNIKIWCELNNNSIRLIENQSYKSAIDKLQWACLKDSCKKIFEMNWHHIKEGIGCPFCNESKGEKNISKWLYNNEINYVPQKTFDGLLGLGNNNLSYDFYLPDHNLLIEYQGEFHDGKSSVYTSLNLKRQQEHDRRKREYTQNHNIKLLEIWYWDFDNIEEILNNTLIIKQERNVI